MKILSLLILLCGAVLAQESAAVQPSAQPAGQPAEIRYAHYATMFASATKGEEGIMPIVDSQGTLRIVPVSTVAKEINAGASPIYFADLVQLIRNLKEENQRLKEENNKLWALAGKTPPPAQATSVVVVQQPRGPSADERAADERQQVRLMLLQRLLAPPSSTVNVNVRNCAAYPALCAH